MSTDQVSTDLTETQPRILDLDVPGARLDDSEIFARSVFWFATITEAIGGVIVGSLALLFSSQCLVALVMLTFALGYFCWGPSSDYVTAARRVRRIARELDSTPGPVASWRGRAHAAETSAEHHDSFFVHGSVVESRIRLSLMRARVISHKGVRKLQVSVLAERSLDHDATTAEVAALKTAWEDEAHRREREAFQAWESANEQASRARAAAQLESEDRDRRRAEAVSTATAVFGGRDVEVIAS